MAWVIEGFRPEECIDGYAAGYNAGMEMYTIYNELYEIP